MAISHRTSRLKLKGSPSVEQLQNGRYKLTVECTTINSREDWYSANKARIFPDFGSLESAVMSIDGLSPRKGEAYADMRLTEVQSGNRPSRTGEDYIVVLTYETLGSAFVQVKDDTFNYVENGLRRVTRQSIAKVGTEFQKTVGTTSITSQIDDESEVTCILANYEVNDTDSYREVTEVYIQAGTLSETEDKVGSQLSIVKETFASTPPAISGYSIANEQESNVDGISTKRFTFLKNNVQLSQSEDKVGSQLSISQQWFNPSEDKTVSGYSLSSQNTSDFEGIKTIEYRFLKEDVQLSQSEDEVGSQNSITEEWFEPSASRKTKTNYSLARKEESNIEGIPTERYTFLKNNVVLSVSEDRVGSQLAITNEVFKPSNDAFSGKNVSGVALSGYSEASREKSNFEGIPTLRYRFLKNNVVLSETEDKVGSQLSIVKEVFNGVPGIPAGYSTASEQESNVDGIVTRRFTFLKNDVKLSDSEDKVGSQNAIIQEWFNPSSARKVKSNYSLAREEKSNEGGISTDRYTFLKDDVQLSESEDKVGSQLAIVQQWFNPDADKAVSGYELASKNTSDFDGIKTIEYRFLKEDVKLSESTDKIGSQNAITEQWFNPGSERQVKTNYTLAREQVSNVSGIPTEEYTFLLDGVVLSETEDKVGSQLSLVKEVFNGTPSPPSGYSIANEQVSDVDGIPTRRFTFLKNNVVLSESEDQVGSQLAIVQEVFNGTPATPNDYLLANTQESDVSGISTKRFTFLKPSILSQSEDKVGSQLAITIETFNETPVTPTDYALANTQESNIEGIPTKRYSFLKSNVELSRTEDKVGSQLSITIEQFDGTPSTPDGYVIASVQSSDLGGIPTKRHIFLKDDIKLSESEDKVRSQLAIAQQWFNPAEDKTVSGYSLASKNTSNFSGIETVEYRFLKDNVVLSETEDKVGSQLAIVKEVFNGTPSTPSGYSIASEQESNVDGIATKRFTFLKPNILSVAQDFNNGQGRVSVQAFGKTSSEVTAALSEVTSDHELISQRESDFAGIKTSTFEYQLDESFIQDRELNGLNRIRLIELSALDFSAQTIGAVSTSAPTSSLFLGSQVIDNGGTIKTRQSTWLEAGTLSVSIKNLAEGVKQVTTVFLVTEGTTVGPVTSRNTSNFEGLKTISVTTMQDKSGNALGANGNTPVCSFDVFSNFTYPGLFDVSLSSSSNVGNVEIELTKAPAQSKVQSKVFVFFTTTSTIQSSDYTYESAAGLWSPNDWGAVSVNARGISSGIRFNASKALRGYRTDSASSSNSASASFGLSAFFNFQGSQKLSDFNRIPFSTTVSPGPVTPVGSKWVLDVKLTAAFDDISGTTYYKKTIIVTDAIPAQVSGDVGGPY